MTFHRARRLPRHRGTAAWAAILGDGPRLEPLSGNKTADIAVIGAGFAGLSAARRLRQLDPALAIVVLDACRIAEGAAGRNSGFMIDLPHELNSKDYAGTGDERSLIALNRQAIGFARDAVAEYQIDRNYFDEAGKVNGAASPGADARNRSYAIHLDNLGEVSERLDAKAMKDLTGSNHYCSGLYTPGTVMLQPAGYIRGLAAGLSADMAIHEKSPATALRRVGKDWRVETPKGTVTASKVILSNNGHLESFGFAKGRLMHLFLYASMTPELDSEAIARLGGAPRWGVTPSDPMGTTMRRINSGQGGNRIVTRTCATLRSAMETSAADMARATRVQRRKFNARFPQLAGTAPEYEWAGHLCLTLNSVSVTKALEPGLYSACAQNGLGTARGTLTGINAAELALGVESDVTGYFRLQDEPKRLPPQPIRDIGANALLRWKEWKARAE